MEQRAAAGGCRVTVANTGQSFECPAGELILDAGLAAGLSLPHNCRGGACGTCKSAVLEGEVDHGWVMNFAISEDEKAAGKCLICQSRPLTPTLVIRTDGAMNAAEAAPPAPIEASATVLAAEPVTPSIRRLVLALRTGRPLHLSGRHARRAEDAGRCKAAHLLDRDRPGRSGPGARRPAGILRHPPRGRPGERLAASRPNAWAVRSRSTGPTARSGCPRAPAARCSALPAARAWRRSSRSSGARSRRLRPADPADPFGPRPGRGLRARYAARSGAPFCPLLLHRHLDARRDRRTRDRLALAAAFRPGLARSSPTSAASACWRPGRPASSRPRSPRSGSWAPGPSAS